MSDIIDFCKQVKVDRSSATPGYWKPDTSPWIVEPLRCIEDVSIREVTCVASAQSSKTLFSLLGMAYMIAERPYGGIIYCQPTQNDADAIMRQRVTPFLKAIPVIDNLWPVDRHEANLNEINFPHLAVNVASAGALSALQGRPAAYVIADEIRLYQNNESVPLLSKRIRTFYNNKTVLISCPNTDTDTLWDRYTQGTMEEFNVCCPFCNDYFFPIFPCLKFEEIKDNKDNIDINKSAKTTYMECPKCQAKIDDRPDYRHSMANNGKYVVTNTQAITGKRSFRWNALIPQRNSWAEIVTEFLNANKSKKLGLYQPLKTLVNETLGEPWQELKETTEVFKDTKSDYVPSADIEATEVERFMACDFQAGPVGESSYFYYSIYGFHSDNVVKLINEGKASDFGQLNIIANEHKVTPRRVLIDCAYNPTVVYSNCKDYNFSPIRGSKFTYFTYKSGDETKKRIWRVTTDDPLRGQKFRHRAVYHNVYEFCNDPLTSIVFTLVNDAKRFFVYPTVSQDYKRQIKAVKRVRLANGQWGWRISDNDHQFDCLKMAVCGAIMSGTYKLIDDVTEPTAQPQTEPIESQPN